MSSRALKILVACLTCPKYLDRRQAVRDTWAPWVEKLNPDVTFKFFTGTIYLASAMAQVNSSSTGIDESTAIALAIALG